MGGIVELKDSLKADLKKELVTARSLLSGFLFLGNVLRTPAFADPKYIPFYYHLSKYVQPKNLLEIGFTLGLLSGAFLKNNKSVEYFLAYSPPEDRPGRLGVKNVQVVYGGEFDSFVGPFSGLNLNSHQWDLVIFDKLFSYDEARAVLDRVWDHMALDGLLVFERVRDEDGLPFFDFCKIHQREPLIFETRYGTGIVQR